MQDESFIVRVDRTKGGQFWFSDHRVQFENEDLREILRYDCVRGAHWMFKDLWKIWANGSASLMAWVKLIRPCTTFLSGC